MGKSNTFTRHINSKRTENKTVSNRQTRLKKNKLKNY